MNNLQGPMAARRISIKTQISSNSITQNQIVTPKSRENSQAQLSKQLSITNNTNMEGVITESDSCQNMMSNNQFIINSRHAAFILDENISNPSSHHTINQINAINQNFRADGQSGNLFLNGNGQQLNLSSYNSQSQQGQQQNIGYVNAFKDKRLTPTMRRPNDGNSFNYENNFFNSQKWKNTNQKKGEIDDRGGGNYENDPQSLRNTVREFQQIDMNRHCIDLQQMQLQRLPSLVQDMKNQLQVLNMSYNNFAIFPQELCQFLHLKIMKLDFNYLSEIPEQIAFLKYLEELSISHNCLKELPGTLQNMSSLRILNVGQNNISQIGQEITNIKKLEVLYIYNNEFTVLPAKIRNLIHLKELGLDWFRYNKPPIDTLLTRPNQNSLFSKLFDLCGQHAINAKPTISFKDFIKHFSLIDGAVDFAKVDARGRSIAFLATESEELGVLKALLEENKDLLNQQDREGQTLLTQALIDNKVRSIQFLLDNGADPRKGGGHLGSSLHMATSKLNQELVLKFLSLGVNPNAVDFEGSTPLHIAFSIFQKDPLAAKVISEQLLSNGADPNILNKDLWTPLHIAVRKNQKDAIKYALQYNEKLRSKLHVQSPNHSLQFSNYSGLHQDDDYSYYQDTRDSQKRGHSYNIKNDFIDENNFQNENERLQIDSATPSKSTLFQFDKSNNSTPKVGSEDLILHNRSQLNQDATTSFSKKSSNQMNRQEEDLSDENEDRSPGQTHRTAHFNNQQSQKISKNCNKFFKFDKKGGANKWTVMHLAANQGNINMLEILSDANSCPYSMTKFNQTPRKVALQSLILFKILRKYENRWMLKNVLGEEFQNEFSARDNVVERNIQNLRGFIAETMKRKEHFLHEQLDLFDDKEFGYSIKENMQNNKVQNPRNKENGNESDEDEILDPELSFEKTATSFKFNGMLAQQSTQQMLVGGSETISQSSSLIMPPNSGTLKPQQFGSILRQNSKGSAQKFSSKDESGNKKVLGARDYNDQDDEEDEDDDLMNDIDECDEDNDDMDDFDEEPKNRNTAINSTARNMVKSTNNVEERSCVFMKNLPNANMIPSSNSSSNPLMQMMINFTEFKGGNQAQMTASKQKEIEEQQKQQEILEKTLSSHLFTDIQSLESEKFVQEVERLKNHFLYPSTIFQESMNVLFLLQIIHIRLTYRSMKFVSDRGTLPRNVHIMNEFLHSKMPSQTIEAQKEYLPVLLISFLYDLIGRIKPLPSIDPNQGTTYQQFNKIAHANRANQLVNLLILKTRDALCTLNCFDFMNDYIQECLQKYNASSPNGDKDHIIAYSTSDYTNSTFLDYENMQNMCYVNNIKPILNNPNNAESSQGSNFYRIVGSPNYYYQQKLQINSRSRKSQSQTANELQKMSQQQGNTTMIKNSKQINQKQIIIPQSSHAKSSSNQVPKQILQDNNMKNLSIPQENRQIHSSSSIDGSNVNTNVTNSKISSNLNISSQTVNQSHPKNSKSLIIDSQTNNQQSFTQVSHAAAQSNIAQPQKKQQPLINNNINYRNFNKQQEDDYNLDYDLNPQFIQLSSRMEEPKMPNELKKIDLNTFGVNIQPQSQYQFAANTNAKYYQSNQQQQTNNQPPGPKNLKNNNTTFISRPTLEEHQSNIQENTQTYKQCQVKNNDTFTISSATNITSTTQTKTGASTATSINMQDVNSFKGINKNQYQFNQFNANPQESKNKQQAQQSLSNKHQQNQSYQFETNTGNSKGINDNNRSYIQSSQAPSYQSISSTTNHAAKQLSFIVQPDVPQKQQHQPNYDTSKSHYNYTSNHIKQQPKSEVHTPQYTSNTAQKHLNEIQQSFSEQVKKNQRMYITKTGEENISDEDLSDDSSKKHTQDANKKYSDHKMSFSPFNKKI